MKKNTINKNQDVCLYKFSISSYGGETVMGHITKEQFEYWKDKSNQLQEYLMGLDMREYENEHNISDGAKFDRPWHDLDNIVHVCGGEVAKIQELYIEEYDENLNLTKTWDPIDLGFGNLEKLSIRLNDYQSFDMDHEIVINKYYFYGQAFNKGAWHNEEPVEISGGLKLSKLILNCVQVEGWLVCRSISYEGLDDEIYLYEDSTGKSQTCSVNEGWKSTL
jgi:hypothetical protein